VNKSQLLSLYTTCDLVLLTEMAPHRDVAAAGKKRGRPQSPMKAAGKKKVKTEDPFDEACHQLDDLLHKDASLTEGARSMLSDSLPHALAPTKAQRHKFQETLVESLAQSFSDTSNKEKERTEAAKVKQEEAIGELEGLKATLAQSKEESAGLVAAKDTAHAAVKDAQAALVDAKNSLKDAKKQGEDLKAKHAKLLKEKESRQKVIEETWIPLKEGAFVGQKWRLRDKKIQEIVNILEELSTEGSLTTAVPVSLKEKPADRGFFAVNAIEFVEGILKKSVESIDQEIIARQAEVDEQEKQIALAGNNVATDQKYLDDRQSSLISAENAHLESVERERSAAEAVQAITKQVKLLDKELVDAQQEHADISTIIARFEAIVEGGAAAAAPPPVEVVEEATAPMEVAEEAPPPMAVAQEAPEDESMLPEPEAVASSGRPVEAVETPVVESAVEPKVAVIEPQVEAVPPSTE